ncbi:MAG: dipeptide epimerase [Chitinophagia bacterium]|nr:dipeptide epimerase [Chitinophagia bacterium]
MLQLKYEVVETPFRYPFTTHKGTKTHQPALMVSLGLGAYRGYGEAPAISYYNVTAEGMAALLESKRAAIERYALTDVGRFWHFLHHLIPGQHFLTAALDIAAWDLFAQMRRMPLYRALGIAHHPGSYLTDYTIGLDSAASMVEKIKENPWPVYKIKMGSDDDKALLQELRRHTDAPFRLDANEGWTAAQCLELLPELPSLGVELVEQPLHRDDTEGMAAVKAAATLPIFADESCVTEDMVAGCAAGFHGINIKLTKCGGITPALRMIKQARELGLKVMLGSMNEGVVGTAALAHLAPLADVLDADGPMLLEPAKWKGLKYEDGRVFISGRSGLGVGF